MTIIMTVTHPNDHDDHDDHDDNDDLPAGGKLMCVWVQCEGVGDDRDLIMIMRIRMMIMMV